MNHVGVGELPILMIRDFARFHHWHVLEILPQTTGSQLLGLLPPCCFLLLRLLILTGPSVLSLSSRSLLLLLGCPYASF